MTLKMIDQKKKTILMNNTLKFGGQKAKLMSCDGTKSFPENEREGEKVRNTHIHNKHNTTNSLQLAIKVDR